MKRFFQMLFLLGLIITNFSQAKMVNLEHRIPLQYMVENRYKIPGSEDCFQVAYKNIFIGEYGEVILSPRITTVVCRGKK